MGCRSNSAGRTLRVGSVPYLVGRPLDLGLAREGGIELVRRVPAELVAGLRAGELDVALVSSIELFREPGYRWLDGLAVAGAGFVGSVQVFLRQPIEKVRSLALDPSSRAAATLVQVLLADPGPAPRFLEVAPGDDPRDAGTDAWLRIGDPALREHLAPGSPPVWNPSQAWFERTRLSFPFAVWIVRAGVELSPAQIAAFYRSREHGLARLAELAEQASRTWELSLEACRKYLFEECRYEPGPELGRALYAFRDRAAAIGLCRAELSPPPIRGAAEHVA
jgi:chorismate dehydratase